MESNWWSEHHFHVVSLITFIIWLVTGLETWGQGLRCCLSSRCSVVLVIKSHWLSLLLSWCSDVGWALEPSAELASTSVDLDFIIQELEPTPRKWNSLLESVVDGRGGKLCLPWMIVSREQLRNNRCFPHPTHPPRAQAAAGICS